MTYIKKTIALLALFFNSFHPQVDGQNLKPIEQGFITPPDSIQTSVYWYWISDNISKEGVQKDLEAMKRVGINRAFIGNIGLEEHETIYGDTKILSEGWWEVLHAALKKATELDIEIGIFNSPGWSQSGGPWVKPEQAMRYLTSGKTVIQGGRWIEQDLPVPADDFQDVKVIAYPAPKGYGTSIRDVLSEIRSESSDADVKILFDGDRKAPLNLADEEEVTMILECNEIFTARNIEIFPQEKNLKMKVILEAEIDGKFQQVKKFIADRSNNELHVGFQRFAPVSESFEAVSAKRFKVILKAIDGKAGATEVEISSVPKVERYVEKTLAKMYPSFLPYWNEYQWPDQADIDDEDLVIHPDKIIDVSDKMDENGLLRWEAPAGKWIVLRTGMVPTGVVNFPASREGIGLEIDKMSRELVEEHFEAFMGEIIRRIPAEDRKTWKMVVQDSYEMGGQNWTDDFIRKFKTKFGYDPLPYIPVFFGTVVGSQDESDRFLWDLRRFIADNVAYEYVGGLREISHKYGLRTWLENYGHWGFPGEFLQYGGQSDEVAGEFWSEGDLGNIENKAASSAAHIYGKRKVSAESFTAGGNAYGRYPAMMKQRGDRFFTEGINNTLLHVYIHQPYEDKKPGVNAWFGNEFNRFNTWFNDMDYFITYLKRCNFMLQQGTYVADVAYFIGEDAPKMTGIRDPELPKGYSYDYINAEVIKTRLTVKNGKFVLPDGLSYRILVLPPLKTMRPELLKKLTEMVKAGGTILGPKPVRSPSLQNYGKADEEVREMANEIWGPGDGTAKNARSIGKGFVLTGMDMQEALDFLKIRPDMKTAEEDPVLFIHRETPEGDIYFLSNQSDSQITVHPAFRISHKKPELWNPIDGSRRGLPAFIMNQQSTIIPLFFEPYESMFILFRKSEKPVKKIKHENFPKAYKTRTVSSPWVVTFDTKWGGLEKPTTFEELHDWSVHENENIRYYSGPAVYSNSFEIKNIRKKDRILLDLGEVKSMAKVVINGIEVGGIWTFPYSVDITEAVKKGKNEIEIKVVNTWVNRLIGDQHKPEEERETWTIINPYKADSPLASSGVLGPVNIKYIEKN